jgi:hypothetical protein
LHCPHVYLPITTDDEPDYDSEAAKLVWSYSVPETIDADSVVTHSAEVVEFDVRQQRANAYANEIPEEVGDKIKAIGDCIDVLFKEVTAQATALSASIDGGYTMHEDYAAVLVKIQAVKDKYPKE